MNFTKEQLDNILKNPDVSIEGQPERTALKSDGVKPSKYHNVRTELNGCTYSSGREAKRAQELQLMEKVGEIYCLGEQLHFKVAEKVTYIADFVYLDKELQLHVEDCKGFRTDVYRLKKKLFKERFGIEIEET